MTSRKEKVKIIAKQSRTRGTCRFFAFGRWVLNEEDTQLSRKRVDDSYEKRRGVGGGFDGL